MSPGGTIYQGKQDKQKNETGLKMVSTAGVM